MRFLVIRPAKVDHRFVGDGRTIGERLPDVKPAGRQKITAFGGFKDQAGASISTEKPETGPGRTAAPDRLNYNWVLPREAKVMSKLTFEQKQDHYDKIRRSNYLASLRLEGFDTTRADADKPLPTREAVLRKYRKNPS